MIYSFVETNRRYDVLVETYEPSRTDVFAQGPPVPPEEVFVGRKSCKRRAPRPGRVRPRDRSRCPPFPVCAGRIERADGRPKRPTVQRGLHETRVG